MLKTLSIPKLREIAEIEPELLEGDKIQPGHPLFGLVWINRQRVSGTPCFYGTRVPLKNLFDTLAAGESLEEFLYDFDGVSREQAILVLKLAGEGLLGDLDEL
jgi:uncharacterized protein (DUF433 family)